jgi:hypothetical protein
LLNASEVREHVPPLGIKTIRCLIAAGNNRNCPKLSIAGLDLLYVLNNQSEASMVQAGEKDELNAAAKEDFWYSVWGPVLEGMTEAIGLSAYTVSDLSFDILGQSKLIYLTVHSPFFRVSDSTLCPCSQTLSWINRVASFQLHTSAMPWANFAFP